MAPSTRCGRGSTTTLTRRARSPLSMRPLRRGGEAPAAFRDAQLRDYDGLAGLPVAKLSYLATDRDAGDLTSAVDPVHYANAPVLLVETRRSLMFTGYDDRASLDDFWWTFVQREGK